MDFEQAAFKYCDLRRHTTYVIDTNTKKTTQIQLPKKSRKTENKKNKEKLSI